jgi:hypothetical protein
VAALLRWAAVVALGLTIASVRRDGRILVLGALALVTLTHVAVALAERAHGGPLGLDTLGESSAYDIGGRYASSGLTVHPYLLAAWCAVAGAGLLALGGRRGPGHRLLTLAGAVAFGGIGLSMSRAGAIGAVLALGALAFAWRRQALRSRLVPVAAAAAAFGAGILLNLGGWLARAGQTGGRDSVTSGRGALLRQAWPLLRDHLALGVGPGRYVLALEQRPGLVALSQQSPRPVHVTPLLLVVEGGILVVPALVLVTLAVVRACRLGGVPAVAVALAMVPFLALDHLAWSYPQGLVLTGVWLGVLDLLGRKAEDATPPRVAAPAALDAH